MELAALDCLENPHRLIMVGEIVVNTLAPSFLNGSSSFLQIIRRRCMKAMIEFRPEPTIDSGVSCPGASEKLMFNVLASLATLSPQPSSGQEIATGLASVCRRNLS